MTKRLLTLDDVQIVGDPHLGRSFIHGVPLHRRGEREAMVRADFEASLREVNKPVWVCLGDLFHSVVVGYEVLLFAARTVRNAAKHSPGTQFVFLGGNHDQPRSSARWGSFAMFRELVADLDNVLCVERSAVIDNLAFCSFSYEHPAADLVPEGAMIAFGHWDTESFGQDNPNLIPTRVLAERGIRQAVTGHVHLRHRFSRDGIDVLAYGSLQPYAHGEETEAGLYLTLTLDAYLSADPNSLRDKCVRVLLERGDAVPEWPDCLQFTVKRIGESEDEIDEVAFGEFDFRKLFRDCCDEVGLSEGVRRELHEIYEAEAAVE